MKAFVGAINKVNEWTGKLVSFLVIFMTAVVLYETVARYVFNAPTMWAFETTQFIYGAYVILIGGYVLLAGGHVNVDVLYRRFPLRARAILDLFTWLLLFLFCFVIVWKGGVIAWETILEGRHASTGWAPPLWPIKVTIPIGAFLLLLQGLSKYLGDLITAFTGEEVAWK